MKWGFGSGGVGGGEEWNGGVGVVVKLLWRSSRNVNANEGGPQPSFLKSLDHGFVSYHSFIYAPNSFHEVHIVPLNYEMFRIYIS